MKAVQYYSKLTVMPQVINTQDLILLLDFPLLEKLKSQLLTSFFAMVFHGE